jgi:hypothetical protein
MALALAMALAIFGVTFVALCIWLTVRIINRREWWAMQLAAILGSWALSIACGLVLLWLAAWGAVRI